MLDTLHRYFVFKHIHRKYNFTFRIFKNLLVSMDLNKLPNDKKLQLCKWYFKVGCILLPFVWAVNAVWFFKEAFVKPPFEEQKQIKKYVIASGAGTLAWAAALGAWAVTFQLQRVSWGAAGDALSFIVPLGRA